MKRIVAVFLIFMMLINTVSVADIVKLQDTVNGDIVVKKDEKLNKEKPVKEEEPSDEERAQEAEPSEGEPAQEAEPTEGEPAQEEASEDEPATEEVVSQASTEMTTEESKKSDDKETGKKAITIRTLAGVAVEITRTNPSGTKETEILDGTIDEELIINRAVLSGITIRAYNNTTVNSGIEFKSWLHDGVEVFSKTITITEDKNTVLIIQGTPILSSDTSISVTDVNNHVITSENGTDYLVLVKDLNNKPNLTIEKNHAGASLVVDDQGDTRLVTVTAENGDTKAYTIRFVERTKPVIQLNGSNLVKLFTSSYNTYIDERAVATDADGTTHEVQGVGPVNLDVVGFYILKFNYKDQVMVYDGDNLVALAADEVIRTVEVMDDYGEVYVQHYDVTNLRALKDASKWKAESFDTLAGNPIIKIAKHGKDNWTQVAYEDAFLNHTSGTTKNAQKVYGFIKPDIQVDGIRTYIDDGIRLYMDMNQDNIINFETELKINSWKTQGKKAYTNNSVVLGEDEAYLFLIDYFNWGGKGIIQWEAKVGGNWITVPAHWFYITPGMVMPELSDEKEITSFDIDGHVGLIDQTTKTILVQVPFESDVTALTPTIAYVGKTINPGQVSNDFTNPVTYTVTAEDGSTVDYIVTVELMQPPVARNVVITGTPEVGQTLTGTYDFYDPNGDLESGSTFQWYVKTEDTFEPISGATNIDYVLTSAYGGKEIKFEVTPKTDNEPTTGEAVSSDAVSIAVKYNFWITVDDFHEVYVNGIKLENKDQLWSTIDKYYLFVEPGPVTIAVKGIDMRDGAATISGFRAAYQNTDGTWIDTDNSWYTWTPVTNETPAEYGDTKWYQPNYSGTKWVNAHVLADPHRNWPTAFPEDSSSKYIWTNDYKVAKNHIFDSPVYFRNTVNVLNAAPEAKADAVVTDEDTSVNIAVLLNDSDFENDTLLINDFSQGENGSVSELDGVLIYSPNKDFNGTDSFTYSAKDDEGAVSHSVTVTVTVNPVNDAPVATGETVVTNEDIAVAVNVLVNDTDVENDPISIAEFSQGSYGLVTEENGVLTYTPNPDYNGEDFFTYTVQDDHSNVSNSVKVQVSILAADEYQVMFNSNGGTSVKTQIINAGFPAIAPDEPSKLNSKFLYWTLDQNEYSFETAITDHIELIAKWQTAEIRDPEVNGEVEAEGIILNIGYLKTIEDSTAELLAALLPEGSFESAVWTIDPSETRISITEDGIVTGLSATGTTPAEVKVTVTFEDETQLTDTVPVTVIYTAPPIVPTKPPTTSRKNVKISLDKNEVELEYGTLSDEEFLTYDFTESIVGSNDRRVTWEIADSEIASVDANGLVTALKEGDTTVTVTHVASGKTASADIIVFLVGDEEVPLGAIEFYNPYVVGYPDQTFGPERSVTRAEIATMFAKILKLNLNFPGTKKFDDVNEDAWYYIYVQAIARTGLFVGDANGHFRPDEPMTNAEVAAVFANYWKFLNVDVEASAVEISDVTASHWASNYIYMMYNAGIVNEADKGYNPDQYTLREEVVGLINTLITRPKYFAETSQYIDITVEHWAYGDIEAASQLFNVQTEIE